MLFAWLGAHREQANAVWAGSFFLCDDKHCGNEDAGGYREEQGRRCPGRRVLERTECQNILAPWQELLKI